MLNPVVMPRVPSWGQAQQPALMALNFQWPRWPEPRCDVRITHHAFIMQRGESSMRRQGLFPVPVPHACHHMCPCSVAPLTSRNLVVSCMYWPPTCLPSFMPAHRPSTLTDTCPPKCMPTTPRLAHAFVPPHVTSHRHSQLSHMLLGGSANILYS